jgi:hypothetical protein
MVRNAIVKGPASLAILLKFVEAHEARQAARKAPDADVAIGLSAMRFASMRWNHSLRRTRVVRLWRNFGDRKRSAKSPRPADWTTMRRIQPAGRLRPR